MNLTKERINALEQSLDEKRIQFELEGDREDFVRLIAYWKSQQPKTQLRCVHCGEKLEDHWFGMGICLGGKTKFEEAP